MLPDAQVYLMEDAGLPDTMFDDLREQIDWQQSRSFVYGQWHDQPRLTALYGAEVYDYSGIEYHPTSWEKSEALQRCRTRVQEILDTEFNAVVCNLYRDGKDSIGWHSDNEPELGFNPLIVSLSFGATRRFSFRRRGLKSTSMPSINASKERHDFDLPSGSMLAMFGETQENWEHSLPKTTKPVGPRINLTFRNLKRR
jgi:alkylated DNA repair dioxygenase AlkB